MNKKIRVALIYKKDNVFMSGNHFDNCYYNFFVKAINRNKGVELKQYPTNSTFDASILKNKVDVILLWSNHHYGMPENIVGIREIGLPVISRVSDPGDQKSSIINHEKWKIDHYFHFISDSYFHEMYPREFNFTNIIFGLEPSLYETVKPFNKRINNKILNTGACGTNKFTNKIFWYIKDRTVDNPYIGYKLRTKCNKLNYVVHNPTLSHQYINDHFPKLLEKYQAVIAATSDTPNINYLEKTAAGCLTFMEITKLNKGDFFGFKDNETSIFINENNYKKKFNEYLNDPHNPKWNKIAQSGREFTLKNLTNDIAVSKLIEVIQKIIQ